MSRCSDTDGPEHIEASEGSGDGDSRQLGMPVQLLYLLLALVNEKKLWESTSHTGTHLLSQGVRVISFHSQVPLNHLNGDKEI